MKYYAFCIIFEEKYTQFSIYFVTNQPINLQYIKIINVCFRCFTTQSTLVLLTSNTNFLCLYTNTQATMLMCINNRSSAFLVEGVVLFKACRGIFELIQQTTFFVLMFCFVSYTILPHDLTVVSELATEQIFYNEVFTLYSFGECLYTSTLYVDLL